MPLLIRPNLKNSKSFVPIKILTRITHMAWIHLEKNQLNKKNEVIYEFVRKFIEKKNR